MEVEQVHPILVALFAGFVGCAFSFLVTVVLPWLWRRTVRRAWRALRWWWCQLQTWWAFL